MYTIKKKHPANADIRWASRAVSTKYWDKGAKRGVHVFRKGTDVYAEAVDGKRLHRVKIDADIPDGVYDVVMARGDIFMREREGVFPNTDCIIPDERVYQPEKVKVMVGHEGALWSAIYHTPGKIYTPEYVADAIFGGYGEWLLRQDKDGRSPLRMDCGNRTAVLMPWRVQ